MIPGLDVILGGITGLIGNAFTTWFKYKNAKMEYEHDEKMVTLQTQAALEEAKANIEITKSKVEGDVELADSAAYTESQKTGQTALFGQGWVDSMLNSTGKISYFLKPMGTILATIFALVDVLRALMRPTLTIYLVGLSTYITYLAWEIIQKAGMEAITGTQALDIFQTVTSTIIFLAVSSVTWWFGDRTMAKYLEKKDSKKLPLPIFNGSGSTKSDETPGGKI
jgi:hypothetical protein